MRRRRAAAGRTRPSRWPNCLRRRRRGAARACRCRAADAAAAARRSARRRLTPRRCRRRAERGRRAASNAGLSAFGGLGAFNTLGVAELKPLAAAPVEAARPAPARPSTFGDVDDDIDAVDAVDLELFPIFEEEAQELLPKLDGQLRDWLREPATTAHAAACMRTLHTLKGGARLAGAMRLGEMAHRLETRIERLTGADGRGRAPRTSRRCRPSPTR